MKRAVVLICLVCMIICVAGCGNVEDLLKYTVNAVVVGVDAENRVLYVSDPENEGIFGEKCAVDCSDIDEEHVLYCDFDTENLRGIPFGELQEGDSITLTMTEEEFEQAKNGASKAHQIQLITQRY